MDPIDDAWAKVDEAWGDAEAHRRFVGVCVALDRLPEAGRRYREVRDRDPSRAQAAEGHIEKLLAIASQQLEDTRVVPSAPTHKRTLTWAAFLIMMILMGAGAWLLLRT